MTEEFLRMLSAAENGDAEKQYRVARAYADGDEALGVQKDEMQAMEWYQKAGKPSGSLAAMHDGALLYVKMMEITACSPTRIRTCNSYPWRQSTVTPPPSFGWEKRAST